MHDAKSNLSSLVREVREGTEREIVICLSGQPVAKLVPLAEGGTELVHEIWLVPRR